MATLYISEFSKQAMAGLASVTPSFPLPAPLVPVVAEQALAIAGGSTPSVAFNDATTFVMLNCDAACSIAWGTGADPIAVATAQRMGANETRFYGVPAGQKYKVAVITNT